MHREVISAFIAPIKYVWEQEFGSEITTADTEVIEMEKPGEGYTFIAPVEGSVTGTFGLYLDDATASALTASMRGRWVAEYEDELQKTLIRVVEKVTAAAQPLLIKLGYECKIGEISWIDEKNQEYPRPTGEGAEQTVAYLETDFGTIALILSFIDTITLQAKKARDASNREEWLASLDFVPDDVPEVVRAKRFELVDDDGHTRAVIGRLGDGSPHVILADDKGQMRCAIWLAPNGTPSVAFFDANGRRSWIAA
jgi:CheY-specific phosphatase CheX